MEEISPSVASPGDSGGHETLKEGETPSLCTNSGRSSPPPDCAICLSRCRNKCFTDSCLHQFCFNCLLTWSKIKAECPLCKQPFKSIIHNVLSNDQYEEYMVEQEQQLQVDDMITLSDLDVFLEAPRFRYTTTLTLHRRESLAIQRLLMRYPLVPALPSAPAPTPANTRNRCQTLFRRYVYRHSLSARPLPDVTGRYRECSAQFYRNNPAQMHRLVPWLKRELMVIVRDGGEAGQTQLLTLIMERLPRYDILSPQMESWLTLHLHEHTRHFLHELWCYASSPFDMYGYDRAVSYEPVNRRPPPQVDPVPETVSDTDSDIVLLSPGTTPGPSRSRRTLESVVAIRTVSPSDSDSSSDGVVMVGYAAPPGARTPEVVDLLASDSDAVVVEEPEPSTAVATCSPPPPRPSPSGLVRVSLKRDRPRPDLPDADRESDSDWSPKQTEKTRRPKRARFVSRHSASTECTDRDTDSSLSATLRSTTPPLSDIRPPYRLSSASSDTSSSDGPSTRRIKRVHRKRKHSSKTFRRSTSDVRRRERFEARSKIRRVLDLSDTDENSGQQHTGADSKTLLDAVSESVLLHAHAANRGYSSASTSMSSSLVPPVVSSLLEGIDDNFFNQPGTSSLSLPCNSEMKPVYLSIKKEEKE